MAKVAETEVWQMAPEKPDSAAGDGMARRGDSSSLLSRNQQPEIVLTLAAIRRDMQKILLPELSSDRARTVAISMDTALRHLIVRLKQGDGFLARQVAAERALLGLTGLGQPDWPAHLEHGALLEAAEATRVDEHTEQAFARLEAQMVDDFDTAEQELPLEGHDVAQDQRRFDNESMTSYLRGKSLVAAEESVARVVPVAGGFSKETCFIELRSGVALVARRDNPFGPIDSTVVEEFELLRSLFALGVPVAEPLLVEPDPGIFGQPFMLSKKVAGRAIPHTTGLLEGNEHAGAGHGLAKVLARLHRLDVRDTGLPAFLRPEIEKRSEHILAQIDYWEDCWRRYRSDYSPILTRGFRWLRANIPQNPLPPCLVHGDAGPHNLMIAGGEVTAMLDWEFATLGDPMADLVYCRLFIDRIMDWDEFLATYRAFGGPEPDDSQVDFFTRFFAVRNAVTSIRLLGTFATNPEPDLIACFGTIKYDRMFRRQLEGLV